MYVCMYVRHVRHARQPVRSLTQFNNTRVKLGSDHNVQSPVRVVHRSPIFYT